ncbi:aldose epimerase family protein [Aquisalinus flavus]|uniref:Aldose 1-epimerase n=1 Tax=Aquisalinus flavus TaxID=1526572 RepID=A0A8J2Y4N3_9PROT|nr:aldose epimerase family protein [Aquisalinus flavus]MBD0427066.1 galactose mutarotase [Aquisalinus flavus]UNE46892.1 galactose mutarotase [Aquisalinus flavus]GGC98108.1 aldose 1-epimerase [Aquisalinus flavus]
MANETAPDAAKSVIIEPFGEAGGREISLYTLTNKAGMMARITNYGGILTHLFAPDADGRFADVVLGYDTLQDYIDNSPYFGALIGRYGNRIGGASFTLDGKTYALVKSQGENTLHGGKTGFHGVVWDAVPFVADNGQGLTLSHVSPDGDEGFPGTLSVSVTYFLSDNNELQIDYKATTDKATPVALTQHAYFNLSGDLGSPITGHLLRLEADRFTPTDETQIPTGDLAPVKETPFDFRRLRAIGEEIDASDEQLSHGAGYDHNFVLNRKGKGLELAAEVEEPKSGRRMEVLTTEPGVQFYSGNFLDDSYRGKGTVFGKRTGFCLETQHFPDSPNQPDFPSTILKRGDTLRSQTLYRFSTVKNRR